MTPFEHSLLSVKKFGGKVDWYLPVHSFLDSSKLFYPNFKHRLVSHNTTLAYKALINKFGEYIQDISLIDICNEHLKEDLSNLCPSLEDWFKIISSPYSYEELLYIITNSDFGVYFGLSTNPLYSIYTVINNIKFNVIWNPNRADLMWLYYNKLAI